MNHTVLLASWACLGWGAADCAEDLLKGLFVAGVYQLPCQALHAGDGGDGQLDAGRGGLDHRNGGAVRGDRSSRLSRRPERCTPRCGCRHRLWALTPEPWELQARPASAGSPPELLG